MGRTAGLLLAVLVAGASSALAQGISDLERERADFTAWLATAPTSPLAAIAQQPIGAGLSLGPPDADVPLERAAASRVVQKDGAVRLESGGYARPLPRGAPVPLGSFTLVAAGAAGRAVLTVFGPQRIRKSPAYYQPDPALVFVGPLSRAARPVAARVLGIDGIEVEAIEAGSVIVPIGGARVRLRVLRVPLGGGEESELEIFFRDGTNGKGTYPAGRFVTLSPAGDERYRLDFNRARNPFCAYSSAYPCPAPWRGNSIRSAVQAGERYDGGGLATPESPKALR